MVSKRPDRFPRESCVQSLMSAHGLWSTQVTMKPVRSGNGKVNAFPLASLGDDVRGLQSQSQEELDALLPSVLDRAFKGEL